MMKRFNLFVVVSLAACGGGSDTPDAADDTGDAAEECEVDTSYHPVIDPSAFVAGVDNPLFPLVPGTVFTYDAEDEQIVVTVTAVTKTILGVDTVEVHDVATIDGEIAEDTLDWYAQDEDGNVWYMGEDTKELEGGVVVSTAGSWEAGVDGAYPGIIIPAAPTVGSPPYRQEYLCGEAEDMGEVLAIDATATVPTGSYTGCLRTHDFTALEPDVNEEKYYCPGVGQVLSVDIVTGIREELSSVDP